MIMSDGQVLCSTEHIRPISNCMSKQRMSHLHVDAGAVSHSPIVATTVSKSVIVCSHMLLYLFDMLGRNLCMHYRQPKLDESVLFVRQT